MKRFIFRRLLSGLLTVIVVFALNFIIIKAAPGDAISTLMGKDNKDPAMRAALEAKYGLDKPLPVQFINYMKTAARGDLGTSMIYNRSVNEMIKEKLGIENPTLQVYRARLVRAGLVDTSIRGMTTLSLPRLKEYIIMQKKIAA